MKSNFRALIGFDTGRAFTKTSFWLGNLLLPVILAIAGVVLVSINPITIPSANPIAPAAPAAARCVDLPGWKQSDKYDSSACANIYRKVIFIVDPSGNSTQFFSDLADARVYDLRIVKSEADAEAALSGGDLSASWHPAWPVAGYWKFDDKGRITLSSLNGVSSSFDTVLDPAAFDAFRLKFESAKVIYAANDAQLWQDYLATLSIKDIQFAPDSPAAEPGFTGSDLGGSVGNSLAPSGGQVLIIWILFALTMIILLVNASYAVSGMVEEKESRVAEMLLLHIGSTRFVLAKLVSCFAIMGFSLLCNLVPIALASGILVATGKLEFPSEFFVGIDWLVIVQILIVMASSALMVAALGQFLGSLSESAKESGQWSMIAVLPMILPIYVSGLVLSEPTNPFVQFMSYFPLTSPSTIIMRATTGELDVWQVSIMSIVYLATAFGLVWLTGKMYQATVVGTKRSQVLKSAFGLSR